MAVNLDKDYRYLAGLLDGEGCFAVYKREDGHRLHLQMTARDKWFLERIQETYGGKISYMGKSALSNNDLWYIRFRKKEILEMLPKVIPHLIMKKEQAQMLLKAAQITDRHRFKDYNPSELVNIVLNIKRLKQGAI